ncbi:alpha/beta hydrolase family protein [Streptomyces bobili]|uniref:alpha/beta hydrolase family protein n=1 Tax=Streptomyces bobili TaxID=67280 RepID=UPI0037B5D374
MTTHGSTRRKLMTTAGALAAALTVPRPHPAAASPAPTSGAARTQPPQQLVLPRPTGRYPIGTHTLRLVDRSRRDPWVPSRPFREFVIQLWYPARRATGGRRRAPWMTPAAARHFQSSGLLPTGYVVLPTTHAAQGAPARPVAGRSPVILYSHGHGQHRSSSLSLVEELAAHGYVVVTIDHTYDAGQVEFPGGRVETYGMPELTPALPPAEELRIVTKAVQVRVADVRHTLAELERLVRYGSPGLPVGLRDVMDLTRTAMFGHSLGGATAAEAMCAGLPIAAGANLDGSLFGEVVTRGLDKPLLLLGADRTDDATWQDTWPHLRGWRRFLRLTGSEHFSFTDYETLLPQAAARLGATPEQIAAFLGPLEWQRSLAVQREALLAFFGLHLLGRPAPLLSGPTAQYPELVFRRAVDSSGERVGS